MILVVLRSLSQENQALRSLSPRVDSSSYLTPLGSRPYPTDKPGASTSGQRRFLQSAWSAKPNGRKVRIVMSHENHPSQFTLLELVVYVSLVGISMSVLASLELFAGFLRPRLEVVAGLVGVATIVFLGALIGLAATVLIFGRRHGVLGALIAGFTTFLLLLLIGGTVIQNSVR